MPDHRSRRDVLRLCGVTLGVGVAGCSTDTLTDPGETTAPERSASSPKTATTNTDSPDTTPTETTPTATISTATATPTATTATTVADTQTPTDTPTATETATATTATETATATTATETATATTATETATTTETATATETATTTETATATTASNATNTTTESRRSGLGVGVCGGPRINADGPLVRNVNSRAVRGCLGDPVPGSADLGEWSVASGQLGSRIDSPFSEASAVSLESGGEGVVLTQQYPNGLDFSAVDLSLGVNLLRGEKGTLQVELRAPDAANTLSHRRYIRESGWMRLDLGPSKAIGSPDLSAVSEITISFKAAGHPITLGVDGFRTTPKATTGRVILTFDDGRASAYDTAFPILDELGVPATVGVIPWHVGENDSALTLGQLDELNEAGWEMASHPHSPEHNQALTTLSGTKPRAVIERAKHWLIAHGFEEGAQSFIWPMGKYDHLLDLVGEYHQLAFGGGVTPSGTRITEPACIPRVDGDHVETAAAAVDFAAEYNQLVVIMLHQVGTNPDRIDTPEFKRLMQHVASADVDVITPTQLVNEPIYRP